MADTSEPDADPTGDLATSALTALVDEIEAGGHGVVLCMGKGGVGKTTVAAAVAVALAHRGHPVHLTTTDPAAHLEETLRGGWSTCGSRGSTPPRPPASIGNG